MPFKRRLFLFFTGVFFGILIMYFGIFKDRDIYKSPSEIINSRLTSAKLELTKHGECRMKCRGISLEEVKEILRTGEIIYSKSQVHDKPCPSYAYEGKTTDGQNVRIIYALCDSTAKVVTAIDLDIETDTCSCK